MPGARASRVVAVWEKMRERERFGIPSGCLCFMISIPGSSAWLFLCLPDVRDVSDYCIIALARYIFRWYFELARNG